MNQYLIKFAAHLRDNLDEFELEQLEAALGHSRYKILMEGEDDWSREEIADVAECLDELPQDLILQHRIGWSEITLQEMSAMIAPDGLELSVAAHAA